MSSSPADTVAAAAVGTLSVKLVPVFAAAGVDAGADDAFDDRGVAPGDPVPRRPVL